MKKKQSEINNMFSEKVSYLEEKLDKLTSELLNDENKIQQQNDQINSILIVLEKYTQTFAKLGGC